MEKRVRYVESEVEGEKLVTRAVLEQSTRNGAVLHSLRSEIGAMTARADYVVQEVVQNTAALRNHGTLLIIMQRDVIALRNDVTELRRGQEEIHVRLDRMEQNAAPRNDVTELRRGQEEIHLRLDRMEQNIAAILAGVLPPGTA